MDTFFDTIKEKYQSGVFLEETSFYFSVGDMQKTVICGKDACTIHDGKLNDTADCACTTSTEMFSKIWMENYRPGIMDFMSGKIKADNPLLLVQLLKAFGK